MKREKAKEQKQRGAERNGFAHVFFWYLVPVLEALLLAAGGFVAGYFKGTERIYLLQAAVFLVLGCGVNGLCIRRFFPTDAMEPGESLRSLRRFFMVLTICEVLAVLYVFLPNTAWVFLPVYILLGVYGSPLLGMTTASTLLMVTTLLSGGSVGIFFLYFVSGAFGIFIFLPLRKEFRFELPMILSLLCLLVCEMSGVILTAGTRLHWELFILPGVNMILSAIFTFVGVRYYSSRVIYRYRDLYQYLNDTEHPKLAALRETDKKGYLQSIHTGYFCERISALLGMDGDVLKCAGYYHRLCPADKEEREKFYEELALPGAVREVLNEYRDTLKKEKGAVITRRETAALMCAQTVILTILSLFEKDPGAGLDVDRLVEAVFHRFESGGTFRDCDISARDLYVMQNLFREEKLYYDFLR